MRLIYLDEAGIKHNEKEDPILCVAGVILHGDNQWKEVEKAISAVVSDWLPPADREGFIFHATDLYHGSRYWDREVWRQEIRNEILADLVGIIKKLGIPVIYHEIKKAEFGKGVLTDENLDPEQKRILMQGVAAAQCMAWADMWIKANFPSENAMVIAEDSDRVKLPLKRAAPLLRDSRLSMVQGLPLRHIIDTVHFAAKQDSTPLQLADLCVFILRRWLAEKPIPEQLWKPVVAMAAITRGILPSSERRQS